MIGKNTNKTPSVSRQSVKTTTEPTRTSAISRPPMSLTKCKSRIPTRKTVIFRIDLISCISKSINLLLYKRFIITEWRSWWAGIHAIRCLRPLILQFSAIQDVDPFV